LSSGPAKNKNWSCGQGTKMDSNQGNKKASLFNDKSTSKVVS